MDLLFSFLSLDFALEKSGHAQRRKISQTLRFNLFGDSNFLKICLALQCFLPAKTASYLIVGLRF
jgi:hypothetical protein